LLGKQTEITSTIRLDSIHDLDDNVVLRVYVKMATKPLQLTLAILKPDVSLLPYHVQLARDRILAAGFLVLATNEVKLSRQRAELFYSEHKNKFFFNRLVTFMTSGPLHVHALAREDAILTWRRLMGPTKVFKTRCNEQQVHCIGP
jgi:nucleoside diphosphate kinase